MVRGKILKVLYFQDQGLEVFLDKLQAQGWLETFTNTKRGCSVPELVEFFANSEVTNRIVTSSVHGQELCFDAANLEAWLGVPSKGFDVYVREDKTVLSNDHLLDLTRKLAQQSDLSAPRFVRKGKMQPLYRLLFWFVIKNVIPWG